MKTSVLIIAHNEEKYISACINSILNQTQKADEVILLAHNCIDKTIEIVKNYEGVSVVEYSGPAGIVNARIEGLVNTTGEIILCIDGDSFAKNNWIEAMSRALNSNNNILIGSWVKFKGPIFGQLANIFNKYNCKTKNQKACRWIWGPSMGFWNKNKNKIIEILKDTIYLSQKLSLSRNPEDLWLALFMSKLGNIEVTNKTYVVQNPKEHNSQEALSRRNENVKNAEKIEEYFKKLI